MAEYIRFRLTAAKVGVTMAFLALLAGLSEKAGPARANTPAGGTSFFNDVSSPLAGGLDHAVIKLTNSFLKLDVALNKLTQTLHKDYPTYLKLDSTFLKIKSANSEFLKIDSANSEFLKLDSPAVNSYKLGGLPASAFVQGEASVVSGMASLEKGGNQKLLQTADGAITVQVSSNSDGAVDLVLHNNTSVALTAVLDPTAVELPAGGDSSPIALGTLTVNNPVAQLSLQILPAGTFSKLLTLTVSAEVPITGGATEVVGQMVDGSV
jgi:hypothetical protein